MKVGYFVAKSTAAATPWAAISGIAKTNMPRVMPVAMPASSRYRFMKKLDAKNVIVDNARLT